MIGNGLYALYSSDGGNTWSDPKSIFLTHDDQLWPFDTKLYLGHSGELHAVWSTYDVSGNGVSVYYANYNIDRKRWSDPLELVSKRSGLSSVIEYEAKVIVTYVDYDTNALWMRQSSDSGQTWTNPIRIAPRHIGRNGAVSMVIDSNDILHLFFGERIPGVPDIHGMWHVTFAKGQLSPVEAVVSGPLIENREGEIGFDPVSARAVVCQGNVLLVTWITDPGNTYNGVWYSYLFLNAPETPLSPLPSQPIMHFVEPTRTVISATAIPADSSIRPWAVGDGSVVAREANVSDLGNPNTQLVFGIIPVLPLLLVVIIYTIYRSKRL